MNKSIETTDRPIIPGYNEVPVPFAWVDKKKSTRQKTVFGVMEGRKLLPEVTIDYSGLGWQENDPRKKAFDLIATISSSPELIRDTITCYNNTNRLRKRSNASIEVIFDTVLDTVDPAIALQRFGALTSQAITAGVLSFSAEFTAINAISLIAGEGQSSEKMKVKRNKALDALAAYFPVQTYIFDEVMKAFNNHEVTWDKIDTLNGSSSLSALDKVFSPSRSTSAKQTVERCTKIVARLTDALHQLPLPNNKATKMETSDIHKLIMGEIKSGLQLLQSDYLHTYDHPQDNVPKHSEYLLTNAHNPPRLTPAKAERRMFRSNNMFHGWQPTKVKLTDGTESFYRQAIIHCPFPRFAISHN